MSGPAEIIAALALEGATVRLTEDGGARVEGKAAADLSPDLLADLRRSKADIIAHLARGTAARLVPIFHVCRLCARPHLSAADAIERPLPGSAWPAWVHASCAVTWAEVLAAGGSHAEASSACWRERDGIERARTGG